jgi:hypothetical protein
MDLSKFYAQEMPNIYFCHLDQLYSFSPNFTLRLTKMPLRAASLSTRGDTSSDSAAAAAAYADDLAALGDADQCSRSWRQHSSAVARRLSAGARPYEDGGLVVRNRVAATFARVVHSHVPMRDGEALRGVRRRCSAMRWHSSSYTCFFFFFSLSYLASAFMARSTVQMRLGAAHGGEIWAW